MANESTAPALPARRGRRARIAAAALAGAVLAAGVAGWLLLRSEAALPWLLSRVPGLAAEGVQGSLGSGRIGVQQLRWQGAAGRLQIDALQIDGLQWTLRTAPGPWLGLRADALKADRVQWASAPGDAAAPAAAPPDSLALPLALQTPLAVGRLQVDALPELQGLSLQLELGADAGRQHRVSALALQTAGVQLRDGDLRIDSRAPLALAARLSLSGELGGDASAPRPWQAELQADGPLQRLALKGRLLSDEAAAVDLDAALAPFARWPLARLQLRTEALDLSRLDARLPQTLLRGHADLTGGDGAPLQVDLQLDNERPGRWNEGRLPLRQIEARLQGDLAQPDVLTIAALSVQAADAGGDAGRWQAQGRWTGHTLTLDNTIEGLRPERLDGRSVAMSLDGQVALSAAGLPSPDPAASAPVDALSVSIDGRLQGPVEGAPEPLSLRAKAVAGAERVQVERFELVSGKAQAQGQADVALAGGRWALRSQGRLAEFDPGLWWPGNKDEPWRRGPHRLNAEWSADVSLPGAALQQPPQSWLPLLRGTARLQLAPSLLAGLPAQAELTLAGKPTAQVDGWAEVAGNRLQVDGRADLGGKGTEDRWQLALKAPALSALAPLAAWAPAARDWAPQAGRASARATLKGRWPAMQTEGEAVVEGLRAAALGVGQASLTWRADGGLDAPLSAQLAVDDAQWRTQALKSLRADLSGTLAQHRLQAEAAVALLPPPAVAQSLALTLQRGTRLAGQLEGSWQPQPKGGHWVGQLRDLQLGSWDGKSLPAAAAGEPWAQARGLRADLSLDAAGRLLQARVDPGRLQLAGGIQLGWDEVVYDGAGQRVELKARLENLRVAPVLARWQPDMGWTGDLEVGVQIDLKAAQRFDADIVIERRSGDLAVRDSNDEPLALGLTDLRLAMNAHDGTWYFTQALAGPRLGAVGGVVRVRTSPERRWPEPGALLDGGVQASVANLGVWGTWVPPGWRLQGQLQTQATFGGSFGAPQVTGSLTGSGLGARNLLLGVNVRDGEIAVRLDGERATVENFVLRAGDGSLRITGGATLGAAPEVKLSMTADRLQVLGRIDRRMVVSGKGELAFDPDLFKLDGQLQVDEGLFDTSRADAPSLDDDVVVLRKGRPPPSAAAAAPEAPRRRSDVLVTVDLGNKLRIRGRGLDTQLAGSLKVTAPAGKLAVNGTVGTVNGTFAAYGQKMKIERGNLAFSGAPDNPRLDVLALRPDLDIEVGVEITGSVNAPRVRLYSNPDMSDSDKLSWLVLGRDPGALGRTDTALLQRAAVALLASDDESTSDKVIRGLGLDELSVRQSDDATREAIVSLGKQISDRWYVGYERGVNATQGTWQVIYRAAKRFTLQLASGLDQSLDLLWVWRVP